MAITKPTKKPTADDFIAAAPDAAADVPQPRQPKYVRKGKKLQITLTIAQPLLEEVLELLQASEQLIGIFDAQDILRFANPPFQQAYHARPDGRRTWGDIMRANYLQQRGTPVQTQDFDR